MYDEIDIKYSYRSGFWTGTIAGVVGTFVLCLAIGLFINS